MDNPNPSPTRSKLEDYRPMIFQEWSKETSILEISRILQSAGCPIKRTRVATWIAAEIRAGRFPPRKEPLVGRPKKNRSRPPEQTSLRPFNADELRGMEGFLKAVSQQIRPSELAAQMGIPTSNFGNPDFEAYAKLLGQESVSRLGTMDYILLAMHSALLNTADPHIQPRFVDMLCRAAESIRRRMRNAVAGDSQEFANERTLRAETLR